MPQKNFRCCQVIDGNWKTAKKWSTHPPTYLSWDLSASQNAPSFLSLESQNPNISISCCARKMFSPRWNVFLFCWQKNPLMLLVLSSVQGLEVYCDIHSSGFVNWKICFNRGRSKSKILILAQILIQKYSNQNISSKVCWKIAFLLGRNCRQYFWMLKRFYSIEKVSLTSLIWLKSP